MNAKPSLFSRATLMPWLIILAGLLTAFAKPIYHKLTPATLDVKINETKAIMPAAYKVYADKNALEGKYKLFQVVITNTGSNDAVNVTVDYEVPEFITNKTAKKIPRILPGQTVVVNCYPSFKQDIVERTTSSQENVNIIIKGDNLKKIENSFDFQMKGRNEFIYTFIPADEQLTGYDYIDNGALLSCYITPEDPIIKYYTQKVQEKILKGETAAVGGGEQEAVRFLYGIYESMRRSHMVYSGTSGVPENIGSAFSTVQSIRLPREVITGKTGLCIELSLAYASILMNAGLDPIIYLVPGHAYPGVKINGSLYAIESTGIGGEGTKGGIMSADQAFQSGMKSLQKFEQAVYAGNTEYMYIDVRNLIKEGALAMELKDDQFLRQKVDEIAKMWEGGSVGTVNTGNYSVSAGGNTPGGGGDNPGGGGGGDTGGGGGSVSIPSGYRMYNGVLNFAYPSSYKNSPKGPYSPSTLVKVLSNSSKSVSIEVYNFNGVGSADQAMQWLQQEIENNYASIGAQVQFQQSGQSGGYTVYNGMTSSAAANVTAEWVGAFRSTGNGVAGVIVGGVNGANYRTVATNVLNTLR